MELHEQLRLLADRLGRQVFDDADQFRGALDDFIQEGEASVGDTNLLVDAVRLGAYQRMNVLMERGVSADAAVEAAGQRLAQDRGTVDIQSGCWACAVLGYAASMVDASEVDRHRTVEAGPTPSEGQPSGTDASPTVGVPSTHSGTQSGQQHGRESSPESGPALTPGDGPSGGKKAASSRPRLVLLGAFAVVVVAAIAVWLLLPSAAPSQDSDTPAGAGPSTTDLSATLELVPDFDPQLDIPLYMMPASETQLQDLPSGLAQPAFANGGTASSIQWYEAHGGVPVGHQTVRLVLAGQGEAPVIISQIRPFVIERRPPLRGWMIFPGVVGSSMDVRYAQANLDCPEHPATLTTQPHHTSSSIDLQVSRSDVEALEVTVYSSESYVRWGLEVTYVSHGQVNTLRVTDPKLRLTGEALGTLRNYTYDSSLVRAPELDATPADIRSYARSESWLCR